MNESDRHVQSQRSISVTFSFHQQKWIWNQNPKLNLVKTMKHGNKLNQNDKS